MQKIIICVILLCPLFPDILHVPDDYNTIQSAISTANESDTILVANGTYTENLLIEKSISLASHAIYDDLTTWQTNQHILNTIIDGISPTGNMGSCIVVRPSSDGENIPSPTINGFTIANGQGSSMRDYTEMGGQDHHYGGGIIVYNSSAAITHCIITNNGQSISGIDLDMGGALFAYSGSGVGFEDFLFPDNTPHTVRSIVQFSHVLFQNNYADMGKTVYSRSDDEAEQSILFNETIFDYAYEDGGNEKVSDYWCKSGGNSTFTFSGISGLENSTTSNLYVSTEGDDSNDGSDSAPLETIKKALEKIYVPEDETVTIQLEPGIYSGDRSSGFPIQAMDRLILKGSGSNSSDASVLDGGGQKTILNADNVDGFRIETVEMTDGYSINYAGALNCKNSSVTLIEINLNDNSSGIYGGGIFSVNSTIQLQNSVLSQNSTEFGGGSAFLKSSTLEIVDSNIEDSESQQDGGALFIQNSELIVSNSAFESNYAHDGKGGAIYADSSNIFISNESLLSDNFSFTYGAGAYIINSDITLENTDIQYNSSYLGAAGIYADYSTILMRQTEIWGNFSEYDGGGMYISNSSGEIESSYIENNSSLVGGGINLVDSDFILNDISVSNNLAFEYGGGIFISGGTFEINNAVIRENYANNSGGAGITIGQGSSGIIRHSIISNNVAGASPSSGDGGGIMIYSSYNNSSNIRIENSLITYNDARKKGGGIYTQAYSHIELIHTNLIGNTVNSFMSAEGGGIYAEQATDIFIVNSILWNNDPLQVFMPYAPYGNVVIAYSDIMDGENGLSLNTSLLTIDSGVIDQEPEFVSLNEANPDYNLTADSPCIDTGTDLYIFEQDTLINLENADYVGSAPDIGTFEYDALNTAEITIPNEFTVSRAYPNPFNPATVFTLLLPVPGELSYKIYDITGKRINDSQKFHVNTGINSLSINFTDFAAGVYFIHFFSGKSEIIRKVTLIK